MKEVKETLRIKKIERKWNDEVQGLETFLTLEHLPTDTDTTIRRAVLAFDSEDAEELLDRAFVVRISDAPQGPGKQERIVEE